MKLNETYLPFFTSLVKEKKMQIQVTEEFPTWPSANFRLCIWHGL